MFIKDAWLIQQTFHALMVTGRRIERGHESCPLFGVQSEMLPIRQCFICPRQSTFKHKVADRTVGSSSGTVELLLSGRSQSQIQFFGTGFVCWHGFISYRKSTLTSAPDNVMTFYQGL
jgi:hypothetical protein